MAWPTADEFADWLTPTQAMALLEPAFGKLTISTLLTALRGGIVIAAAERSALKHISDVWRFAEIPREQWEHIYSDNPVWKTAHTAYDYTDRQAFGGTTHVSRFGVRFEPKGVQSLLPPVTEKKQAPSAQPQGFPGGLTWVDKEYDPKPTPAANKGGAPRKEFWDDLWVEMCMQIYRGDLKPPLKQVDIENKMLDWASMNGKELSVQSVRTVARKLLAAFVAEEKDKN